MQRSVNSVFRGFSAPYLKQLFIFIHKIAASDEIGSHHNHKRYGSYSQQNGISALQKLKKRLKNVVHKMNYNKRKTGTCGYRRIFRYMKRNFRVIPPFYAAYFFHGKAKHQLAYANAQHYNDKVANHAFKIAFKAQLYCSEAHFSRQAEK